MDKVALVTDSTADLPLSYYSSNDVWMVPLTVRFGEECFKDWVEIEPRSFYDRLSSDDVLPKTSQPSVADFTNIYQKLAKEYDHIISVHLSSKLSGTIQSAEVAKEDTQAPVAIVDTKLASLGTGMVLDALVKARDEGKSKEELVKLAWDICIKVKDLFTVDTLKYLEKGGRIGKAQALVGSLLNIRPILTLEDGIVVPYKKVKGKNKMFKEMVDAIAEYAKKGKKLKIGFAHAQNPEAIRRLKEELRNCKVDFASCIESEIGAVIGTYTGPKAFAVMYYQD